MTPVTSLIVVHSDVESVAVESHEKYLLAAVRGGILTDSDKNMVVKSTGGIRCRRMRAAQGVKSSSITINDTLRGGSNSTCHVTGLGNLTLNGTLSYAGNATNTLEHYNYDNTSTLSGNQTDLFDINNPA